VPELADGPQKYSYQVRAAAAEAPPDRQATLEIPFLFADFRPARASA